jgi:hypothetical protein
LDPLLVIGTFVLGASAGALLTSIAYLGRIRKLKNDIKIGVEGNARAT